MSSTFNTSSPRMVNIPSKLVRARNIRPIKKVRPLKRKEINQSINSELNQSNNSINSARSTPDDLIQNYNEIVFDNKTIRVYSTDDNLLQEAMDALKIHFNRRVIDLLL